MNVARHPGEFPLLPRAVAIGTFDGVHLGHQAVIRAAVQAGLRPTVVTFDPHPRTALGNSVELLCTLGRRLELLEACGIEDVLVIEFTLETAELSPTEFAHDVLDTIGAEVVVAGAGFRFGRRREGDCDLLRSLGLDVREVPLVAGVSSTRIRALANAGELEAAAKLLGRPIESRRRRCRRRPARRHARVPDREHARRAKPRRARVRDLCGRRRRAAALRCRSGSIRTTAAPNAASRRISSTGKATSTATGSWSSSGGVCETSAPSQAKRTSSPRSPATLRRRAQRHARLIPRRCPSSILLNGPPAVGKSTLARRYADDSPAHALLEIDAVRALLGAWLDEWERSGPAARQIALAMARTHLEAGNDVIVPQLLTRRPFVDELQATGKAAGATFHEFALLDPRETVLARYEQRAGARRCVQRAGADGETGKRSGGMPTTRSSRPCVTGPTRS